MKPFLIRIILFILFIGLFISNLSQAAEKRLALVIGNGNYSSSPLKNPVNDATDIAKTLQKLGFKVTLKTNAKLHEMEETIETFGNRLKKGGVGLFYYAGHGLQVSGINYLIPVDARINKESDVKYKAVDANKILDEMANANNGLNIVILDACRDNPFTRSFRNSTRGLAIVSSAPTGTFISYSTSPGNVARDGEGRNSPYTKALLQYMQEPGVPIGNVFMKVRQKLRKETGQVPWELSSLEGDFYFLRGKADLTKEPLTETVAVAKEPERPSVDLDDEQLKIEAERERLKKEKELLGQQVALAEERRELEEKKLAMGRRPSHSTAKEIKRDGRFIAYDDGTVLDTRTNLMWAAVDNGSDVNWQDAKNYCENYKGGGYNDWRMPTQAELAWLYDASKSYKATQKDYYVHLTNMIQLSSCCPWASEIRGSGATNFVFDNGRRGWDSLSLSSNLRALPVRSVK